MSKKVLLPQGRSLLIQRLQSNPLLMGAVIVTVAVSAITVILHSRAATGQIFSPSSFWYQPVPANAPLDPLSSQYAAGIASQVHSFYGGNGDINTTDYSPTFYNVPAGVPTTNVKFNDCQGKGWVDPNLTSQFQNVPIPANATVDGGTDKEMAIYQASTDQYWEFWVMDNRSDGWYACWGGRIDHASQNIGQFMAPYGSLATGLAVQPGQIGIAEVQAGSINHAIGLSLVHTKAGIHSWPANRDDGCCSGSDAVPEGTHLRLDPSINVDSFSISPFAKMVAKAAQKYGFIIWDTSGVVGFRAENPLPLINAGQSDPWPGLMGGVSYNILAGFPWDKLQALQFNYGMNGTPTVSPTPTTSATPTPTPTPPPTVTGDLNGDGKVNIFDLSSLLSKWGTNAAAADLNHDGTVNVFDLSDLLSHWAG